MNRIFGFSRNAVALIGVVVAIILVVLVGMIVIGSAALRALMVPGVKPDGVSLYALLVTIIVLLSAVFILLLVIFWCCCRSQGKGRKEGELPPHTLAALLPILPLLPQLPVLLGDLGVAIFAAGKTLTWVQGNLDSAAGKLDLLADTAHDATLPIPAMNPIPDTSLYLVPLKFTPNVVSPLLVLETNLRLAAEVLKATTTYPVKIGNVDLTLPEVGANLVKTGKALARVADAFHANPPPPIELLQP